MYLAASVFCREGKEEGRKEVEEIIQEVREPV